MNYRNLFLPLSNIILLFGLSIQTAYIYGQEDLSETTTSSFDSETSSIDHSTTRRSKKCHLKNCRCKKCNPKKCDSQKSPCDACKESRFAESPGKYHQSEGEKKVAYNRRVAAACISVVLQKNNNLEQQNNGDEKLVPDFAAQFSKTLEHDFQSGLLTPQGEASYKQLVTAINDGEQADFNAIIRAPGATVKLVNPQAALAFSLQGADSSLFEIPRFPLISSAEAAALLLEDYLMELTRDVLFSEYGTGMGTDSNGVGGSLTNDAAAVLQDLGNAYTGPRNAIGVVDASVIFRGNFYGSLIGPYISQFILLPLMTVGAPNVNPALFTKAVQSYPIASGREFGVSFNDFVTLENGKIPKHYTNLDFNGTRYIVTGRDMASYVHFDTPYEEYYNAITILASNGFPLSTNLPYQNGTITNETPFATMGLADVFAMIGDVTAEAAKAAWAQKWRAQRALRPEAFGGLVQLVKITGQNPFNLNQSLFELHAGINVLELIRFKNMSQAGYPANMLTPAEAATYLLSQVYPEASPAHPSYPAGHGVIAGACITIIKAIYEDTTLIKNFVTPVIPNPANPTQLIPLIGDDENIITVASELDKLAFNIALGRDWAGIHYRADGLDGILLGENVAIEYLREQACKYTEQTFNGFILTKVDGTRILINAAGVTVLA